MPCKEENGFLPEIPADEVPDLIYLCFPNNPTGGAITKAALQEWVDYANKNGCVIIYDAAYEAYISEEDVPHSIYECEGARTCAIELRSFSKNAGFTDEERACFTRALESGFIDTFRYFTRIKRAFTPGGPTVSVHERRTPAGVSTISLFPLP